METIDTRDLYTRKCELETLRDAVTEAREALEEARTEQEEHNASREDDEQDQESWTEQYDKLEEAVETAESNLESAESEFGPDEQEELAELENLESEIGRDFMHGETMIPEAYFEDYARELAEDLGTMEGSSWPCTCIDWEKAADELRQDYTSVTYQGDEYLVRA